MNMIIHTKIFNNLSNTETGNICIGYVFPQCIKVCLSVSAYVCLCLSLPVSIYIYISRFIDRI